MRDKYVYILLLLHSQKAVGLTASQLSNVKIRPRDLLFGFFARGWIRERSDLACIATLKLAREASRVGHPMEIPGLGKSTRGGGEGYFSEPHGRWDA